ncbi:MAG TPA: hypothetical protein VEC57_00010 [Candidatus Limnocylindrales bacterium]|nr:hypothetical protein [Candidatus Limnocylindrales bacterium]
MNDDSGFTVPVSAKITPNSKGLLEEAYKRFGVREGALVRMAVEDYVPRYLANHGRPDGQVMEVVREAQSKGVDVVATLTRAARRAR